MDITPFFIEFQYRNNTELAEVKPCCQEDNVYYYDILMRNEYQFTITPGSRNESMSGWRVALKNADKQVDDNIVKLIGSEIESHYLNN